MIGEVLVFFGQYGIFFIILISLINFRREARTLIALGLSLAVSYLLGAFFYSPRPFVSGHFQPLIPHAPNNGFPSHHAAAGLAMSFSTLNTNTVLGAISFIFSVLMVIGRVYAGIHSKTDVIAGIIIGGLCAIFAYSDFMSRKLNFLKNKIQYYWKKKAAHKVVSRDFKKRGKKPKGS